ncbi:MAG: hypothetical protein EBR82_47570 [Caulobacteraceae bacterium]|nr:hypothetical protein [Caulobacteraceae bacterium]
MMLNIQQPLILAQMMMQRCLLWNEMKAKKLCFKSKMELNSMVRLVVFLIASIIVLLLIEMELLGNGMLERKLSILSKILPLK